MDHFSQEETGTWVQRYFVNDQFFDGSGPVFLCVGGEGSELTSEVVRTGTVHCAGMVEQIRRAFSDLGSLLRIVEGRQFLYDRFNL